MDETNRRILTIVIFLTVVLSGFTYIGNALMHKVVYERSLTIEESKKDGYFLAEYQPLTPKIKLTHHPDSVEFVSLWTERMKKKEKVWFFYKAVEGDDVCFKIDYKQYPSKAFLFQIEGYGDGGSGKFSTDFKTDTVTFQSIEKSPVDTVGWRQKLMGQQIKFVRKSN